MRQPLQQTASRETAARGVLGPPSAPDAEPVAAPAAASSPFSVFTRWPDSIRRLRDLLRSQKRGALAAALGVSAVLVAVAHGRCGAPDHATSTTSTSTALDGLRVDARPRAVDPAEEPPPPPQLGASGDESIAREPGPRSSAHTSFARTKRAAPHAKKNTPHARPVGLPSGVELSSSPPAAAAAAEQGQGLEATAIQRTVRRYSPAVRQNCWQRALNARAPGAPSSAKVTATITVDGSGRVQSVSATGAPRAYPGLAHCLETAVKGWSFPRSRGETVTRVPFLFVGQ